MAMREPHPRLLSLDEAVEAVYQDALAGRSVAEAAAEYAHQIDDRDIGDALIIGVAELAHRKLARQRKHPENETGGAEESPEIVAGGGPAPVKAKPHAGAEFWRSALAANYEAADGTRKALIDFNLDDALYLRNVSGKRADGLIRVRDAMDRAVSALQKYKAERIGDLPSNAQRIVAEGLA